MSQHPPDTRTLRRFVLVTDAIGLLSITALVALSLSGKLPLPPGLPPEVGLGTVLLIMALTVVSQLAYVKVPHGQVYEELAFFEVVVAAGMLLVRPVPLLGATLLGLLAAEILIRREPLKLAYNLGNFATSTSTMIVAYHVLAGDSKSQAPQSVLAMLVALSLFAAVNLGFQAQLHHLTTGARRRDVWAAEWKLSGFMVVGGVGVGMTAVMLIDTAPALAPFTALPALALWYAYSRAAQHAEAQERNRWLIELGGHLAGRGMTGEMLGPATEAVRRIVGAPQARILDPRGPQALGQSALLTTLAADPGPRALREAELPAGWQTGFATLLDLGGGHTGALLLGSTEPYRRSRIIGRTRGWSLKDADAPVLGALVAAVGSSMRAGAAFATLSEERDKLTAVVDNTSDGIAMVDDSGRVRLWSQTMVRMTGVRPEDLGEDLESSPSVVQVLVRAARSASRAAGAPPVPVTLHRGDGETLDVSVTTTRVREATVGADAAEQGWVSILTVHDETRERRVERMKTNFIATVSHELRTPITPIKGYAHLLATRRDRLPAEKVTERLLLIVESANHLERLVDDLITTTVASGSPQLRVNMGEEDLSEVIRKAVAGFPAVANRISVTLPEQPLLVQCDRDRTIQCLANLIGNAVKYAVDSPIGIVARVVGDSAEVHVRDHGPGIPEGEHEKVFEQFYRREDPFTMRTGGAGLGLHIARELAESMGGGLTLQDPAEGSGAEFVLHLRTSEAPRAESPQEPEETSAAPSIRTGQDWRLPRAGWAEGTAPDTAPEGHEGIVQVPGGGTMGTSADQRAAI